MAANLLRTLASQPSWQTHKQCTWRSNFPVAGIMGCNFHFCQCVWRHVQGDASLRGLYVGDPDFALSLRMFPAIAFVPLDDVRVAFDALLASDFVRDNEQALTTFLNYFEATWVGRERNQAVMKAEWWNVHMATLDGMGRTNNEVEGWHHGFAGRLGSSHPTFIKLMEHLQIEQGRTEFTVSNSLAQGPGAPRKRVYRERQKRLFALVSSYVDRELLSFLRAIAHNITF